MISSILEEQCQSICELIQIQMHLQAPACSSEIPAKISNMMTNSNLIRAPTSWQHMARWKQLAVHKKLCFFRPQVRDESEASPPTLPTSQRPPLCDLLSRIFSHSNFCSQACAPNRPGGALFPMAPAELGASWTFEVSCNVPCR